MSAPLSTCSITFMDSEDLFFKHLQQICTVAVVLHRSGGALDFFSRDVTIAISNFLGTGNHESLPGFDSLDEQRCFEHRFMGPSIQPRHTTAHDCNVQRAAL